MISVIVPIYNLENELERCILSIVNQSYTDLEIILVNDGSTDGSLDICNKYANLDNRIIVVDKKNGGELSARNAGLIKASGDYIGHIDGDDWIEPEYFERLYAATQQGRIDVVVAGIIEDMGFSSRVLINGVKCGIYEKEDIVEKIYPVMMKMDRYGRDYIIPSLCSKLFRNKLHADNFVDMEGIRCDADVLYTYCIMSDANTVNIIDDCLYHYVRRDGSIMNGGEMPDKMVESVRLVDKMLTEKFVKCERSRSLQMQLKRYTYGRMCSEIRKWIQVQLIQYIFPYEMIEKGSRIILYGAGVVGRNFYMQLEKNKYADVVLWVDNNYKKIDVGYADIHSPEKIMQCDDYNYIIVCLKSRRAADEVICNLNDKLVDSNKIIWKEDYILESDCI